MSKTMEIHEFSPGVHGGRNAEAVSHPVSLDATLVTHLLSSEFAGIIPANLIQHVPKELQLGSLGGSRLRVKDPFAVKLVRERQDIIAEAVEINEFGFGKNVSEALSDLQAAVTELYFTLEREKNRLGPDLARVWAILQQKVSRRL